MAVTIVSNHDTQPLQALENVVEAWFTPIAYALTMLRRDGYPCVFCADYFGAEYSDKGRDGQMHSIVIPSHRFLIDTFLQCGRDYAFGDQIDNFDHPNCIAWSRSGDDEHPGGMVVVISNGDANSKRVQTGNKNEWYRDVTRHFQEDIQTDQGGWADFGCPAGSLSVRVPTALLH